MATDRSPAVTASVAAAIAAVLGGSYYLVRGTAVEATPTPTPPPVAAAQAQEPAPPPSPPPAASLPAPPANEEKIVPIVYPDGSQLPPLNGVKAAPALGWPAQVPFTKVVGTFRDHEGLEWYRHADGSMSTTQMVWRKDLGRMDALGRIINPTAPMPIDGPTATPPAKAGQPGKPK